MRAAILYCLFVLMPAIVEAEHQPLIPSPQRIEYGNGATGINGLKIQISPDAAQEDRFAASELARLIRQRTGLQLRIERSEHATRGIISLERTGDLEALPAPGEKTGPNSREAYHLEITSEGALVRARTSAGVFYGVQTLVQLAENAGENARWPEVRIDDWPSLAYRGTMVDMSEGPLPTEAEVKRQIDFIARWKGNQYYFYNEDSVELDGYPLLNPDARFSKEQVQGLISYARARHIDVVPCLELYGHQHDLFRIERYSRLADFAHGGEFDPANPAVKTLLGNWVDQYLDLFSSRFVHIGFDETWEIAQAAREKGAGTTPAKLFLEQLNTIARRFQEHGRLVMAWGDIMVKYPDIVSQLPQGLAAVPWWYEPEPDPEYQRWLQPLIAEHVPIFVAPGVNMWSEIAPDFNKSFRNIDTFLSAGKKAHALGLINTLWTDDQESLRRMAWPGIAYGAAAAWQSVPMTPDLFFDEFATLYYPIAVAPHIGQGLRHLSKAELALQSVEGANTMEALWTNPFGATDLNTFKSNQEALRQTRLLAESAEQCFSQASNLGADPELLESWKLASKLLDYAGMRGLYAAEIQDLWLKQQSEGGSDEELWSLISGSFSQTHGRIGDILDALSVLAPEYRKSWLLEYTPYRLGTAMVRWNREYQYWWQAERRYREFRSNYKKGTAFPPLATVIGEY